jgi:serine/threonine protein kinase
MALDTSKPTLQSIGNYDLLEKIAEGGMGAIYKARHRQSGQVVAIKIMPPHMAGNNVLLKRFEQEFRAASRLDHPNIVRALDYGDTGSTPYLVMEFVEGESLGQKIERDGALSETEAIKLIAQVAQGLHRAHKQGMIHRDVKPDNILVTPDGQAKLADLGLVKEVDADLNLTRTGRGLGTPHFMAPEQFRNAKNADIRCDVYSLGATLYMMVTGELPFKSNGPLDAWMKKMQNELVLPRQINPNLSERVEWAIRRAMNRDPEQRPASCREFVEDLTGHSTRKLTPLGTDVPLADIWYLVYRDEDGETHTVKGSTGAIRRSLKDGLLGDASNVRASRSKTGPFESLRGFPEFRDLVVVLPEPAATPVSVTPARPTATPGSSPGSSARRSAVQAAAHPVTAPVVEPPPAPHIDLKPRAVAPYPDWLKTAVLALVLVGVAVISATVAFLFLPR